LLDTIVIVVGLTLVGAAFCWTAIWPWLEYLTPARKDETRVSDENSDGAKEEVSDLSENAPPVAPSDQPTVLALTKQQRTAKSH
jgi:hypothetical protein